MTLAAVRRAYRTWHDSRGEDVNDFMELAADDVHLITLADGASPLEFSRSCRDKADFRRYLEGLIGDWDLLGATVEEMIAQRDWVVLLLETSWRNRRTDRSFSSPAAHAWRFHADKATEIRLFFDSARWTTAASGDAPRR
ncbi:MAG: nuclear transport factor 2 family protein [Alphaproteobacteria bacterium]